MFRIARVLALAGLVCASGCWTNVCIERLEGETGRRAIDAEHVRSTLPTGDRPEGGTVGIQGGTFESWFTTRQG